MLNSGKPLNSPNGVLNYYQGKSIFITGCTGFLGKVLLEKVLRVMPDIGRIYVLIRNKKGSPPIERFKKEILGSPCFDRLRKQYKNFDEYIVQKVHPISGDMLKEGMELNPHDLDLLVNNVNLVIHCAASVDFTARLDIAIQVNVRGTLKIFELCKKIKNLENFVHISTCYVNSDKRGLIDEKIYDISGDAEEVINALEKMPVDSLENLTNDILGDYPNTYTFTKAMVERILKKKKPQNFTQTILRPSIIGSSWKEPFIGWVDTVSAAGAIYLLAGIGLLRRLQGSTENIGDQIPVDIVADWIILSGAYYANNKSLNVLHCASSGKNPVTWNTSKLAVMDYWNKIPPEKAFSKCSFNLEENETIYKAKNILRKIPALGYQQLANLIGNSKMKRNARRLIKMLNRAEEVGNSFKHFTMYEWIFKTEKINDIVSICTPNELKIFQTDLATIDWSYYVEYFCWGLHRFVLKEMIDAPDAPDRRNLIEKKTETRTYFNDIKWALSQGYNFSPRPTNEMKHMIMASQRVQEAIRSIVQNRKDKRITETDYSRYVMKKTQLICDEMFSTYTLNMIRGFAWFMKKIFRQIYEKVVVDENSLDRIMKMDAKENGPLVLIPTHRSYIDFILVSYIFFAYGIKCPHIAAAEDFLSIFLVNKILRSSGAFFIKRKKIEFQKIYRAVFYEYIQRLLLDESSLEFFIEGTRSRSGKTLSPKFGILSVVVDTYLDKNLPDVQIVPITINYERVLEGETFPFELLGEEKVKESLGRIVGAARILKKNFGRVYVEFNEPISLKQYMEKMIQNKNNMDTKAISKALGNNNGENQSSQNSLSQSVKIISENKPFNPLTDQTHRTELIHELGYEIVYSLNDKLVIMPTSMVASVLLMNRKGISEENLIRQVEWLTNELIVRGAKIGTINESGASVAVRNAISCLENLVNRKRDIFHPSVSAKADYKNILLLSYYRNQIIHVFLNEAMVVCSLVGFGRELAWKEGVDVDRLWEEVSFLQKLIKKEYVLKFKLDERNFRDFLEQMIQNGVLLWSGSENGTTSNKESKIKVVGDEIVSYLCYLIWPFIESYWITIVFMFSLRNKSRSMSSSQFLQQVQWFAESMYEERAIEFYESCSQDTIKNALSIFKDMKVIKQDNQDENDTDKEPHIKLLANEEQLTNIENHIQKFMKNSFSKTVRSPIEVARRTTLVDYPFMPKL